VSDDTDVFVLLVHFYNALNKTSELLMVPTSPERNVTNIGATVRKHGDIVQHVLALHTLTGCDTVSSIYGIGKVKAAKVLQKDHVPSPLGDIQTDMETLVTGATKFITACYGSK